MSPLRAIVLSKEYIAELMPYGKIFFFLHLHLERRVEKYVTGEDPQLERLKRNESNRVYWFETIILSLVYL